MSAQLLYQGPLNNLSFGNVSYNILREFYARDIDFGFFPDSEKADFTAFDAPHALVDYITQAAQSRYLKLDSSIPSLRLWHIHGAETRLSPKQFLFSFYELSTPTPEEVAIVRSQEHTFFSSTEAVEAFREAGCKNVSFVPLGLDQDFHRTEKIYYPDNITHWVLVGKFERRKNTQAIIQCWLEKFGNNPNHVLTCLVNNPFIPEGQYKDILQTTLGGRHFSNINFLPHLKTNAEVNELINSADIDLSGFSNAEGWNLPAFNATALGKWSIVSNCSSHKDWANEDNCILVEPTGAQECYDNFFFVKGRSFNQGYYASFTAEALMDAMDRALEKSKTLNEEGLKLADKFDYDNTVNSILAKM